MSLSRRTFLQAASGLFTTPSAANDSATSGHTSRSDQLRWRHGLSLFGDLKYAPHFPHFDYVNPHAPKAGVVRQGVSGTFDNFNMTVDGRKGVLVAGIDLIYDTLLTSSLDEVSSAYVLMAEAITHQADFSSVT